MVDFRSRRASARAGRALVGVCAAVVVLMTGCAADTEPASAPLPPGRLLTSHALNSVAALPSASTNHLITYMSEDPQGRSVVVSGTVAVPKSPPPTGGWPVISWAHGTTGYADACAPSADFDGGPVHDYLASVDETLDKWVSRGFVVVRTDYQGLGVPGGAPYSNGASEANNVIDIVRAARELDRSISTDWIAMGHSQGGQAALFTAADAAGRAPELQLKGAVSLAPGSNFGDTVQFVQSGGPGAEAAQPFLPLLVLGAAVAEPAIDPAEIFAPEFKPFVDATRTQCLGQLRALKPVPTDQVFAPGVDLSPLTDYFVRQEPEGRTPQVPVMIGQGLADTTVAATATAAIVKAYCEKSLDVSYRTYPGIDHRGVIDESFADAVSFVDEALNGRLAPETCEGS